MEEKPEERSIWEDFKPVGVEQPPPRAPWHVWLMMAIGLAMVGALLGVGAVYWWQTGGLESRERRRREAYHRTVSKEEFNRVTSAGALGGAAVGFVVGLGIWVRARKD
jgi:hypothetical protein